MIIGISGKKQSGKDTVGKIIQIITTLPHFNDEAVERWLTRDIESPVFVNKKFADMLKDTVCMWIGCTREQLEDEDFKNKELGEEWWYWKFERNGGYITQLFPFTEPKPIPRIREEDLKLIKLTPRLLMQLLGTECGRDIIHPNIWVNSLMSQYKPSDLWYAKARRIGKTIPPPFGYPNWVITDVRFPNEAEAIKKRNGLLIRVESKRCNYDDNHPSETALDDYGGKGNEVRTDAWDKIIFNDSSLIDLIKEVRKFLLKKELC